VSPTGCPEHPLNHEPPTRDTELLEIAVIHIGEPDGALTETEDVAKYPAGQARNDGIPKASKKTSCIESGTALKLRAQTPD